MPLLINPSDDYHVGYETSGVEGPCALPNEVQRAAVESTPTPLQHSASSTQHRDPQHHPMAYAC